MIKVSLKFKNIVLKEIETLDKEITIGRSLNNIIRIDNAAVSKRHARIIKEGKQYFIEDLNSTNGTYLNDYRVTGLPLRDRDRITIGKHTLDVSIEESPCEDPNWNDTDPNMDRTVVLGTRDHKEIIKKSGE